MMKKRLLAGVITALICGQASAQSWLLTDAETSVEKGNWQINSQQLKLSGENFSIQQKVLHGGKQEGSGADHYQQKRSDHRP